MPKHAVKCTGRKAGKTTVVNPMTKRCVIINGRTYHQLVKTGVISKAVGHKSPKTLVNKKKVSPRKVTSPRKYTSPKKVKTPKKVKKSPTKARKSPNKKTVRK